MAKHVWKGAGVFFGEYEIGGDTNEVSLDPMFDPVETTNFKSRGFRDTTPVMAGINATVNGFVSDELPTKLFFDPSDATLDVAPERAPLTIVASRTPHELGDLCQVMVEASCNMFKIMNTVADVQRYESSFSHSNRFLLDGKLAAWGDSITANGGSTHVTGIGEVNRDEQITALLHLVELEGTNPTLTVALERGDSPWGTFANDWDNVRNHSNDIGGNSGFQRSQMADEKALYVMNQARSRSATGWNAGNGNSLVFRVGNDWWMIFGGRLYQGTFGDSSATTRIQWTGGSANLEELKTWKYMSGSDALASEGNIGEFVFTAPAAAGGQSNGFSSIVVMRSRNASSFTSGTGGRQDIYGLTNVGQANATTRNGTFAAIAGQSLFAQASSPEYQVLNLDRSRLGTTGAAEGWWRCYWTVGGTVTKAHFAVILDGPSL